MAQKVHITIAAFASTLKVLYVGGDKLKAAAARDACIKAGKADLVFTINDAQDLASRRYRPAADKLQVAEAAANAERLANAAEEQRKKDAALKRAAAEKLLSEAEQLEKPDEEPKPEKIKIIIKAREQEPEAPAAGDPELTADEEPIQTC